MIINANITQSLESTFDHPFCPPIRFLRTQLTINSRYMAMVAMTVLVPITELPGTRQPSIQPSIILLHKLQETATENNNLLAQNDRILQNNNKVMQNTLTITQDNLQIAENFKSILETILNHFCKNPDTNRTSPPNKKDNQTTTSDLKTISVLESLPIKKKKKRNNKSNKKRAGKPVRTSITKKELQMLQLMHNRHLS